MNSNNVYNYPSDYAMRHKEIVQYRESLKANIACKEAIEDAISNNYKNNSLNARAVDVVLENHRIDRILFVLANTIQMKSWDGRFTQGRKEWAKTVVIHVDEDHRRRFIVDAVNPGLTDLFTMIACRRSYELAVDAENNGA